jgi:hypothetical protein
MLVEPMHIAAFQKKGPRGVAIAVFTSVFNYCLHLLKTAQIKEEDDD